MPKKTATNQNYIEVKNANVHNLKNLSVKIPKNKLVVITGVSGSGKSSLAFDTIYAEGQRRYVESLSSYARQFLGIMTKPDVESITGLSPAISINQKTTSSNPRSTVGTVTEINDYLRLLFANVGATHCPQCGQPVHAQTIDEITQNVLSLIKPENKIQILAPIVQGKKGSFTNLFEHYISKGFARVRVDGNTYTLDEYENFNLDKNKKHYIELIIDRFKGSSLLQHPDKSSQTDAAKDTAHKRLVDAIELATSLTDGEVLIEIDGTDHFFSENNTCTACNISFPRIEAASFSFNSPKGACPNCHGLGYLKEIDIDKIYNPRLTIREGGIFPWNTRTTKESWTLKTLESVAKTHGFNLRTRIGDYPQEIFDLIFYGKGAKPKYTIEYTNRQGLRKIYDAQFEGVIPETHRRYRETTSDFARRDLEKYFVEHKCTVCQGRRLNPYSLAVTITSKSFKKGAKSSESLNISQLGELPLKDVIKFLKNLQLNKTQAKIAKPIVKEVNNRLQFLLDVGLEYLTLNRKTNTLSGGEAQRIRLASQIGTGLTGVLYVLDEPSIGLHARDIQRLIKTLIELRDLGNTVIVVEHDYDTMKAADWIIDIGPKAGVHGGKLVGEGSFDIISKLNTLTAKYLSGKKSVGDSLKQLERDTDTQISNNSSGSNSPAHQSDTTSSSDKTLTLTGVTTHNLKSVTAEFPLGKFICVTGVSGSGKSSLVNDTLYPILMNEKMRSRKPVGEYTSIDGLEYVDKVIGIDQTPIGRTPRSNPVTYIGAFTHIRELFANTNEAKARGYKPGRFSFNVKGGRCEHCKGDGQIKIEMQFLADMYVTCEHCKGKRYNETVLDIDYKGKNIADVLDMTVNEAVDFFKNHPPISRRLNLLKEVGLGYIKLGQPATTLSGGESQRIKLAKELSKMVRGHTVYILDEPTTGLHFHDIDKLLLVLKRLVARNNTVIVIEHNLDLIKFADWIIDMGPGGGDAGGKIVATGTVQDIANNPKSVTGNYL